MSATPSPSVTKKNVVLLSCVKSKRSHRCKAGDMYVSPLFQKMMAYAQILEPRSIFILCQVRAFEFG